MLQQHQVEHYREAGYLVIEDVIEGGTLDELRRVTDGFLDTLHTDDKAYLVDELAEGRFVKACDKLDMALQAQSYSAAQGLDLEEFVESALRRLPEGMLRELATPAAT